MALSLFTVIKILPLLAVIGYEFTGGDYSGKFKGVFGSHFDGNQDFVLESIDQILKANLHSIDDDDLATIGNEVYNSLSLDEDKLESHIDEFVEFISDWTRTKTSIFATIISVLAVIVVQIMTTVPNQDVALSIRIIDGLMLLLMIVIIILLWIDRAVDRLYRNRSPYHYGDQNSIQKTLRSYYKYLHPWQSPDSFPHPRPVIIGSNLIGILAVVVSDLLTP